MVDLREERRSGLDRRKDPHECERDRYDDILDAVTALSAETLMEHGAVDSVAHGIGLATLRDMAVSLRVIAGDVKPKGD